MNEPARRTAPGLAWALLSAMSFGMAGTLASSLMTAGWSPAAAVATRATLGGLVLLPLVLLSLRGRWHVLRTAWKTLVGFGVVAVAACQLCYFFAVERMPVGIALLVEFLSPIAVLGWLWLRHHQRPSRVTLLGAATAVVGLLLVIDVFGGLAFSPLGIMWSLLAMVGAAVYFVLGADDSHGLPPISLAGGGLIVGAGVLWLAGVVGLVPLRFSAAPAHLGGRALPSWLVVGILGVVAAGLAYASGIQAARCLGSRLSSFVALLELVLGNVFAWVLLAEVPTWLQAVGAALILLGVVLVKVGEPASPQLDAPLDPGDGIPIV